MLYAYTSDRVALPLPDKHPFPRDKYRLTRERVAALAAAGLAIELRDGPAATDEELLRVHTPDYVRRVRSGELTEQEQREIGFPWSEGFVGRQLHSTGATLAAARAMFDARQEGHAAWGCHLAGGTHHAFPGRGQGFCVFNDMAVAVRALRSEGVLGRALILDLDVHQGNGTAAIFADDPDTFTASLHGAKNFPRVKGVSDLDVPLPDGCEDTEYLARLDETLAELDRRFDPQGVFYIAGADPYEHDRYGRMKLTKAGLRERDRRVAAWFRARCLPVVAAMGGGYARDVEAIADIYAATVEELALAAPG